MYIFQKYPPIKMNKLKQVPDKLVYHTKEEYFGRIVDRFAMFSTKNPKHSAIMICSPEMVNRENKVVPSLFIQRLISFAPNNGLGTTMLNFAENLSKKSGCEGNFHLQSSSGYTPTRIPHLFYKKFGMNTADSKINKKLDKFISKNKNATWVDFKDVYMFYPPIEFKKTPLENITTTIKNSINKFCGLLKGKQN